MKNKNSHRYVSKDFNKSIILLIIISVFVLTRGVLIEKLNSYTDYDEGTYLLIARYINHGYLPYRDIFAVHPPFYYYLLAGWLKVFGDSYISGRLLSLTLGMISLVIAYLIGKELKNSTIGIVLAGLLTLDPLFIELNSLVFHESLIELLTLLSVYCFLKYYRTHRTYYAYLSIGLTTLGTTAKFTMIPFLVSLYFSILMIHSEDIESYYHHAINIMISSKQLIMTFFVFLLTTVITIAGVTSWPSTTARILLIVPGIHKISKIGHIYATIVFISFWSLWIIYSFGITYVSKMINIAKIITKKLQFAIYLASVILGTKGIIEIPLGLLVSKSYINQTYLAQSGRGFPFITGFVIVNKILNAIQKDSPDTLVQWIMPLSLITLVIFLLSNEGKIKTHKGLNVLFLNTTFLYLIVFPMLPGPRYLLPALLVGYIAAVYILFFTENSIKKISAAGLIIIILISLSAYGMSYNYPQGTLKFAFAPHTKGMMDDLGEYLNKNNFTYKCFSANPMITYYLGLKSDPLLLDTFGIIYLKKEGEKYLINSISSRGIKCIILDSWMYAIKNRDKILYYGYGTLENYTIKNGTLMFGESYNNGEILEMFDLNSPNSPLRITTYNGNLLLLFRYHPVFKIKVLPANYERIKHVIIEYNGNLSYSIIWYTSTGQRYSSSVIYSTTGMFLLQQNKTSFLISFSGIALTREGNLIIPGNNYTTIKLCTQNACLLIKAQSIRLTRDMKLQVYGSPVEIEIPNKLGG